MLIQIILKRYFLNIYFFIKLIFIINQTNNVFCLEKICGEYISKSIKLQEQQQQQQQQHKQIVQSKGVFNSYEINQEINKFNILNITEPTLCIYKFIAGHNEKVLIKFDEFDVKSFAPDCLYEYIDIYIDLNYENIDNYLEYNFLSRWCGFKKPNLLISFNNIILFVYHTDGRHRNTVFSGSFEFISAEPFNNGRVSNNKCEYEFYSSKEKSGYFVSPTYPGTYPNLIECYYKFIGEQNERVSIYFDEISTHFGAEHCPYDAIKVYDKFQLLNNNYVLSYEDLIQTYCGTKKNFTVYSTSSTLLIKFETSDSLSNGDYDEDENKIKLRRGFRAYFKFSKEYVDLSFITGQHIKGTNCDQRFISTGDTNGILYSPNHPHFRPINAVCQYIFKGLNDNEYFESVKLKFHTNIVSKSINLIKNCNHNSGTYLAVAGTNKTKQIYCLNNDEIQSSEIRSLNSQMILHFYSTNETSRFGFVASYSFFTEFGIVGTRVYPNRTCLFLYSSKTKTNGVINSPRYPQNYSLNTECVYIFEIQPHERLLISFKDLKLAQLANNIDSKNCPTDDDHLSIYQHLEDSETVQRYCGTNDPSPFISDSKAQSLKLHFYSNGIATAQGFYLDYNYLPESKCKYNFTSNLSNLSSGSILITEEFEDIHLCEWHISVEHGQSLLFMIQNYNITDNNCMKFALKFYDINNSEKNPIFEYCIENKINYFQVDSKNVQIKLISGSTFFMKSGKLVINWITGKKKIGTSCPTNKIECIDSKYCIDSSYYCDKIDHCNDKSDEPINCDFKFIRSSFPLYHILIILTSIVIFVLISSIFIICKLKLMKRQQKKKRIQYVSQPVFYKYSPTNSMDYLEAAITSV